MEIKGPMGEAGMSLALRWGGKSQEKKPRDQGVTASACHCPTLSSNSPVLLMLPRRKLIWMPRKTAEPPSLLLKKKKKRKDTSRAHSPDKGGTVAKRGFDGYQWRALECLEEDGRERGHG